MNGIDELERLGKLKQQGLLTDAEFEAQKSRVLTKNEQTVPKPKESLFTTILSILAAISVCTALVSAIVFYKPSLPENEPVQRAVKEISHATQKIKKVKAPDPIELVQSGILAFDQSLTVGQAVSNYGGCDIGSVGQAFAAHKARPSFRRSAK